MSRIRSIYPGQWTDEDFVVLSAFARLLALGVRNEADDNGIFEWKPLQLKMRLFPADAVDVGELLAELEEHRHVASFHTQGRRYGVIRNFARFNKPRRPTAIYPMPAHGQVPDEFLVAEPNATQHPPADDERQPQFALDPHDVDSAQEKEFPTSADIVRPYLVSVSDIDKVSERDAREGARCSRAKGEFEKFWGEYPHKVGKGAAERHFVRARRNVSIETLIAGVHRYKASKPADREWCNPATWLSQQRWEDEPARLNGTGTDGMAIASAPSGPPPPLTGPYAKAVEELLRKRGEL